MRVTWRWTGALAAVALALTACGDEGAGQGGTDVAGDAGAGDAGAGDAGDAGGDGAPEDAGRDAALPLAGPADGGGGEDALGDAGGDTAGDVDGDVGGDVGGDTGGDAGGDVGADAGGDADAGGEPFEWPVETYPIAITPDESWKNTVSYDGPELFVNWGTGDFGASPRWVKFTVLMHDPSKLYFQNSNLYPFHAPFAVEHLDPFAGMSVPEFDTVSLHEEGQEAILGAVLLAPDPQGPREVGIQLVRQDPYHREMVRIVFELVRDAITADGPIEAFYFPTYEQAAQAEADADWLAAHDVPVSSAARWATGDACYATGWAVGRLTFVPGDGIDAAYAAGTLLPTDVLLTDGVPAEVPYVAGIVSLAPSTPNSHVAILATNFGVPFVHLALPASQQAAQALVGHRVAVRTRTEAWSQACTVDLVDLDGLDEPTWELLLERKAVPPLVVAPKKTLGQLSKPVDGLLPADIQHFGGKASNFALLRKAIPDHSPEAIAFSFDLFDGFMAQTFGAQTLQQAVDAKLAGIGWPTDVAAAQAALADVRAMIEDGDFTQAQRDGVIAALGVFDPAKRIRFRSSTNVEDSDTFTGAGLYDSVSGCLADDLDDDEAGPSLCDPDQPKERSVFRAIRKVYASFWNDNAFLERRRRQVDEATVGMALLVHHSYPDEIELANGVATLRKNGQEDVATLVTQEGAVSVTNPEGGALPEVVRAIYSEWGGPYLSIVATSSLVPLGATILEYEGEYLELAALFDAVRTEWEKVSDKDSYLLDFEYKKVLGAAEPLQIKQVRAVSLPGEGETAPIQVGDSIELCTFQGEYGTAYANHRLKTRWQLTAQSGLLSTETPAPAAADATVTYVGDGQTETLAGAPAAWADSQTTWSETEWGEGTLTTQFMVQTAAGPATWRLTGGFSPSKAQTILLLRDLSWTLEVEHPVPVPTYEWTEEPVWVTTETVLLTECPADDAPVMDAYSATYSAGDVSVTTSYHWPPPPTGITAGYTAPLVRWEQTTIAGLTPEPIVLKGWYSQTYRPEHHNFGENLVFEPRLEPGIDPAVVAALEAQGARTVYVRGGWGDGTITLMAADGSVQVLGGGPK